MQKHLGNSWEQGSLLIQEAAQPDISFSEEQAASLHRTTQCFELGECLCSNSADQSGRHAVMFHEQLVKRLKLLCWSKKKEKSESRKLLESGFIVLALAKRVSSDVEGVEIMEDGSFAEQVYLHVSYVNYSSWKMTVLPLYEADPSCVMREQNRLLLQTRGLCEDGSFNDGQVDEFQFSIHFFRKHIDFSCEYGAMLCRVEDDHVTILSEKEFKSGYVQIVKHLEEFTCWRGLHIEIPAGRARTRTRRNQQPSRKREGPGDKPVSGKAKRQKRLHDLPREKLDNIGGGGDNLDLDLDSNLDASAALQDLLASENDDGPEPSAEEEGEDSVNSDEELLLELENRFGNDFLDRSSDEEFVEALLDPDDIRNSDPDGPEDMFDDMDAGKSDVSSNASNGAANRNSSSSSSSSDSDSDDDAGSLSSDSSEKKERKARAVESIVRAPGVTEEVLELGDLGELRFNQNFQFLRAHCPLHGRGCLRQRTVLGSSMKNRKGQGRPIGLLVDWLLKANDFSDAAEHKRMGVGSFQDRKDAREVCMDFEGSEEFAQKERDVSEGEEEEPERIP